jgi:acetoin utilization protein AcuB
MSRSIALTIGEHMSTAPATIESAKSLDAAHELMQARRIHHLPVTHAGQLVGMVTARDLALVEALPGVNPAEVPVEEAMSQDVYVVSPDSPLRLAVAEMAQRKLGSAVVMEHGQVVGVFTATDACRVLSLLLSLQPASGM